MSTPHIEAKQGDIAETILLPVILYVPNMQKPFRNPVCYNEVRNMLGYTVHIKGKNFCARNRYGNPSISIYATELMKEYNVQNLVRVGICGAIQKDVKIRDVILSMSASTDSQTNRKLLEILTMVQKLISLLKKPMMLALEKCLQIKWLMF